MTTTSRFSEELRAALPGTQLLEGAERELWSIDGCAPEAVVEPATIEEVATVLRLASREDVAITPLGGGTKRSLGNAPSRCDVILRTHKLDEIIEHEPADLTIHVQAGMTLGRLQAALMEKGQFLPIDPPLADRATVGGIISTNASGPLRLAFGSIRERLIGVRFVRADGVIARSGAKVVKNVAGYDVHKVMIGAIGTLGVIAEASFKVSPLPLADQTTIVVLDTPDAAFDLAKRAIKQVWATLWALEVLDPNAAARLGLSSSPGWTLIAYSAGSIAAVERQTGELAALARDASGRVDVRDERLFSEFWRRVRDFGWDEATQTPVVLKVGVEPSRLRDFVKSAVTRPGVAIQARAGLGIAFVYLTPETDMVTTSIALRQLAGKFGGHLVVERCPTELKPQLDVWGRIGPELELMKRIKQQFDPKGTLNPGRYVGGI